jgi:DnaJ-class molecular chaperone
MLGAGTEDPNLYNYVAQFQHFAGGAPCPYCGGRGGHATVLKEFVFIPRGAPEGYEADIWGVANAYAVCMSIPHVNWTRSGNDLIYKHAVPISCEQALHGFNITMTHLSGEEFWIYKSVPTRNNSEEVVVGVGFSVLDSDELGNVRVTLVVDGSSTAPCGQSWPSLLWRLCVGVGVCV